MPINNITQTISTIPPAGARGIDVQTQFVIKQEDFQDHLQGTTVTELNTLKDQLNSRISEINSTATTMNGYADTASAGASTATTKAGEASTSAGEALTYRNQAETFKNNASASATKASQWSDNNYNVEVETGRYSAKHWSTVAQNATANKIDKVASTDNAIVRFDGATGQVQNSSVIIDDNGNVGIGIAPAEKLHLSTGSASSITIRTQNSVASCDYGNDTAGFAYAWSPDAPGMYVGTSKSDGHIRLYAGGGEKARLDSNGNLLLLSGALGYGTGSGGTVQQLTSKSTAVTLNKPSGYINMIGSELAAGASATFTFNNSLLSNADTLNIGIYSDSIATQGSYRLTWAIKTSLAYITLTNQSASALYEAPLLNFAIIKGAVL